MKKYRLYLFLIGICWLGGGLLVQASEVDSLVQILPQLKGKDRVKALNRLAWKLRKTELDSAQNYAQESVKLAEKLEFWEELATAHSFIGVIFRNKGNYIYALNHFYQALNISEKHELKLQIAYSYNNIGDILGRQGKNKEAVENITKAIQFFREVEDKRGEAYGYIRLGETYQADSLYTEALDAYQKCLKIRLIETADDADGIQSVKNRIGQVHNLTKNYKVAIFYYRSALEIAQKVNDQKGVAGNMADLAIAYQNLQQYDSAIILGEIALKLSQEVGVTEFIQKSTGLLSELYARKGEGNFQRAYQLAKMFSDAQSALIREENQKILLSLQTEYQVQKQQAEIEILNKNKRIQQVMMGALVVGLILLGGWLFSMKRASIQRKRNYEKLREQKTEIETQAENLYKANKAISEQKYAIEEKNTALEDALNKLRTVQSKIAESEKMASLGQMIAGIAHELNNPINFVYAGTESLQTILEELQEILDKYDQLDTVSVEEFADLQAEIHELKDELEYEEMKEDIFKLLEDVHNGASRTAEIVMGLRTFARMDSKNAKSVDIHQSLDSTLVILNNKIEGKAEIIKEYDRNLPYITCFQGQMNQVFMNLLANAVHAIEGDHGKIRIKTEFIENEQVRISISDNGKGMDTETQAQIFQPFFTTKETDEGQGLGLSITRDIIEKHQGKIQVESQLGKGTTIALILPVQAIHLNEDGI